jgi:hypothetical protein
VDQSNIRVHNIDIEDELDHLKNKGKVRFVRGFSLMNMK